MKSTFILLFVIISFANINSVFSQTKDTTYIFKPDSVYIIKMVDDSLVTALSINFKAKTSSYLLLRPDSTKASIAKSYVKNIKMIEKRKEDFQPSNIKSSKKKTGSDIKVIKPSKSYLDKNKSDTTLPSQPEIELGINIGTPAGFNLFAGFSNKNIVCHFSGMDMGTINGFQIDAGYPLVSTSKGYSALGLTFGTSKLSLSREQEREQGLKNFTYTYFGALYLFSYKLLYGQFGLGYGEGMENKLQLLLQIGVRLRIKMQ